MTLLKNILNKLAVADDQADDWYLWASNQLAHAMIGGIIFGFFSFFLPSNVALGAVIIFAFAKEVYDLRLKFTLRLLRDSSRDVLFQILGGTLIQTVIMGNLLLFIATIVLGGIFLFLGVKSRFN